MVVPWTKKGNKWPDWLAIQKGMWIQTHTFLVRNSYKERVLGRPIFYQIIDSSWSRSDSVSWTSSKMC